MKAEAASRLGLIQALGRRISRLVCGKVSACYLRSGFGVGFDQTVRQV